MTVLTTELVDRIIAVSLHQLGAPRPGHRDASFLYPLLTAAGPRSEYPDITKTAIARFCWWVDHDFASCLGDLSLIRLLDSMAAVRPLQWSHKAIDDASTNAHVHVLEYWRSVKGAVRCVFTDEAVVGAARNGHKRVLQWWIRMQDELTLPLTGAELHQAIVEQLAFGGHSDLIQWWTKEHAEHFVASQPITPSVLAHAIAGAFSRPGTTDLSTVHELVSAYQVDLKCPTLASQFAEERTRALLVDTATANIHVTMRDLAIATCRFIHAHNLSQALNQLELLASVKAAENSVLKRVYSQLTEDTFSTTYMTASLAGSVSTLNWLLLVDHKLEDSPQAVALDTIVRSMTYAAIHGHVHVLDWWWDQSSYCRDCVDDALDDCPSLFEGAIVGAVSKDQVLVLEWLWDKVFCRETTHVHWPAGFVRLASAHGSVNTLRWWRHYGQERQIPMDPDAVDVASANGQLKAVEFWFEEGMMERYQYQVRQPFTDRDEDADLGGDRQGKCARDQVFAWWIQSGKATSKPFGVLVGLSLSKYPILLDMFLRKFSRHVRICSCWADTFRLAQLKQPVLLACKVRGRGHDSMAEYWHTLDVGPVDRSLRERQQRVESLVLGREMEWSKFDRELLFMCSLDADFRTRPCVICGEKVTSSFM